MEEKEVLTTEEQEAEIRPDQPEEQPERLFTQAEVNQIIKKRLSSAKSQQAAANETTAAELAKREARLNCREYLIDKGYSSELLDIIGTDDFEAFKQKTEAIYNTIGSAVKYPSVKDGGEIRNRASAADEIEAVFKRKNAHTPKKPTGVF